MADVAGIDQPIWSRGRTTGSVGCLVQASLCASVWRAASICLLNVHRAVVP
jgi:hypothetical protein